MILAPYLLLAKHLREDSVLTMLNRISNLKFKAYQTMMESMVTQMNGYSNL